jgi:hypothetical protein
VAVGDTVIRAKLPGTLGVVGSAERPVSVFPGTPPLPTGEISGAVVEAGKTPFTGGISGALIEVLDGLIAGRTAKTGVPPELPPGFLGPFGGSEYYRILAVPPGRYHLHVSAQGFITEERVVSVLPHLGSVVDFELRRQWASSSSTLTDAIAAAHRSRRGYVRMGRPPSDEDRTGAAISPLLKRRCTHLGMLIDVNAHWWPPAFTAIWKIPSENAPSPQQAGTSCYFLLPTAASMSRHEWT